MSRSTELADILNTLSAEADPAACRSMEEQYGIHSEQSYGVPMRRLLQMGKDAGTDHELALELWAQGSYEAQTLAALIDDPKQVTAHQMERWSDDFENWAIVDTVCFRLFDKADDAWIMVHRWVDDERLYVKRAGFALLWALALHDRATPDTSFTDALVHARQHADDTRPLVGKSITMALRAIATKRPVARDEVVALAQRLSDSSDPAERRVGRPIVRAFG